MKRSTSNICLAFLLVYGMVPVLVGYSVSVNGQLNRMCWPFSGFSFF